MCISISCIYEIKNFKIKKYLLCHFAIASVPVGKVLPNFVKLPI
jgi:hypothetical protein